MSEQPPARTSVAAVASLLLGLAGVGLLSLVGLPLLLGVAGLPAVLLGLHAVRTVNASDGRLRGRGLALAGMLLGGVGTAVTAAGVLLMIFFHLRAAAQRAECSDHLRQIGLAANSYADQHEDTFPPATLPNRSVPSQRRLSWLAGILPYLGEGTPAGKGWSDLAGQLDRQQPWDAPVNAEAVSARVGPFLCPANPARATPSGPGLTSYVGVAGIGLDAEGLSRDNPRAGLFGDDRGVARKEVTAGISFTLMAVETARDNGPWAAGGPPSVRGLDPDEDHYLGPGRPFGGLHPGGTQVLWVDSSVAFLRDTINPATFRSQATLRGSLP